jgi:hypothetical protein
MIRKVLTVVLIVGLLASTVPVDAASRTVDPEFRAIVQNPTLSPGGTNQVSLTFLNDPDDFDDTALNASNVEIQPKDTGRLDVQNTKFFFPQLVDPRNGGEGKQLTLAVQVPANVSAGTYEIPLEVDYQYETRSGQFVTREKTVDVEVRVEKGPRFVVKDTNSTATVGGRGTFNVTMKNVGEHSANDATLTMSTESPDVTVSGGKQSTRFVEEWKPGETRNFTFDAGLTDTAEPGNYTLNARVAYEDKNGNAGASPNITVGMRALPEQTFSLSDVTSSLRVGDDGKIRGQVTNTGPLTVQNAVVVFKSNSEMAQAVETEYAVGTLAPGESAPFSFQVDVKQGADPGPRQYGAVVTYRNPDGDQLQSNQIDLPARVGPNDAGFDIENVESTLRVGEEGTVRGSVVNTGDQPVSNAVLVLEKPGATVTPIENEYALGNLDPGQRSEFDFDVEVSSDGDASPRQLNFYVTYRNEDNQQQQSDDIEVRVDVAQKAKEFAVEPVEATLSTGESGQLRLEVTNTREETFTDISAKIYTESPLSSSDDEAFIKELEPGETETIVFKTSVGGSALAKTYPVKLDFQYDDSEGETIISETYQVPVGVTESGGGGLPFLLLGAAALLVVGAGGYVYYRRQD